MFARSRLIKFESLGIPGAPAVFVVFRLGDFLPWEPQFQRILGEHFTAGPPGVSLKSRSNCLEFRAELGNFVHDVTWLKTGDEFVDLDELRQTKGPPYGPKRTMNP